MAIRQVQLLPESFNLDPQRFELSRTRVTDEVLIQLVSTFYLAKNWLSIAARSDAKPTIVFVGDFSVQLRESLIDVADLELDFNIENRNQNETFIKIEMPPSFFRFDPVKKSTIRSEGDIEFQYFFEIVIL